MRGLTDKAVCRRESDEAVAAFLAAGGSVTVLPGFGSGQACERYVGKVIGLKPNNEDGWVVVIHSPAGQFWAYGADHPDTKRPKLKSIVNFELAPVPALTGHVAGRMKAVRVRDANAI